MTTSPASRLLHPPEPRWPAVVALVAVAGLHLALPRELAIGPPGAGHKSGEVAG
ncbi:hypothetical protein [Armatimonas sp.]|uniref:hypothetical protein n=1 Tax=Armatimonas sp. TaxID=1872638 RepID=UPI00286B49A1|nr:hypothetical protein [Armatimonas sp.]